MLKNAYDFLRSKGFLELDYPTEKDTEKVNLSYGCDDIVDELRQEVMLYDWDTPTRYSIASVNRISYLSL